nr:MAG TPA_asm: hypothetical protein [Caudoviricetes sp.]
MNLSTATAIIVCQLLAYVMLGAGWFANFYKLATYADYAESTGKTALRIIGVFIWPIGGVVGWF